MRSFGYAASLIAIFCSVAPSHADDDCDSIWRNGLQNITRSKGSAAAVSTNYFNNCSSSLDTSSDEVLAEAEVKIFGAGAGKGKFDRKSSLAKINDWCKTTQAYAEQNKNSYFESISISSDATQAWSQCKALQATQEVEFKSVSSDNFETVTASFRYRGASPSGVRLFKPNLQNYDCQTDKTGGFDGISEIYIKAEPVVLSCKRKGFVDSLSKNGQLYAYWPNASIQIVAGAQPMNLNFSEIYDPPLPEQSASMISKDINFLKRIAVPVGSVMPFFLADEDIALLKPYWIIADGQKLSDPESKLHNEFLPDLRDRFILGGKSGDKITSTEVSVIGGSQKVDLKAQLSGINTSIQVRGPNLGATGSNMGGPYISDSSVNETDRSDHTHKLEGVVDVGGEHMPPFRKLIYLVRVK